MRYKIYDVLDELYIGNGRRYGAGELIDFANELLDADMDRKYRQLPASVDNVTQRIDVLDAYEFTVTEVDI